MSGFSAEWLALREPADMAARSQPLTRAVAAALAGSSGPVRALDLATGSGSNVRYLAAHLPVDCEWLLVDADARLLKTLQSRLRGMRFDTKHVDLSNLEAAHVIEGRRFVTASALLDLVSEPWLTSLAEQCARADAVALFTLSYDGRIVLTPADPDDATVTALVNQHQRTDKGFGTALGPEAATFAVAQFQQRGYRAISEPSDWVLSEGDDELQKQLIDGWAAAAMEVDPAKTAAVEGWRARRVAHVGAGRSRIVVGHQDVLAIRA